MSILTAVQQFFPNGFVQFVASKGDEIWNQIFTNYPLDVDFDKVYIGFYEYIDNAYYVVFGMTEDDSFDDGVFVSYISKPLDINIADFAKANNINFDNPGDVLALNAFLVERFPYKYRVFEGVSDVLLFEPDHRTLNSDGSVITGKPGFISFLTLIYVIARVDVSELFNPNREVVDNHVDRLFNLLLDTYINIKHAVEQPAVEQPAD